MLSRVGFTTYTGTVTAYRRLEGPAELLARSTGACRQRRGTVPRGGGEGVPGPARCHAGRPRRRRSPRLERGRSLRRNVYKAGSGRQGATITRPRACARMGGRDLHRQGAGDSSLPERARRWGRWCRGLSVRRADVRAAATAETAGGQPVDLLVGMGMHRGRPASPPGRRRRSGTPALRGVLFFPAASGVLQCRATTSPASRRPAWRPSW